MGEKQNKILYAKRNTTHIVKAVNRHLLAEINTVDQRQPIIIVNQLVTEIQRRREECGDDKKIA